MIIAIDFDGTIVEHKYPDIGKEMLFAFETMKELQKQGHQLILWTYRSGKELEEAVAFCREKGIEFYAVNKNYPEEVYEEGMSRKIRADFYIDDRNLGGFPGWSNVWQVLKDPAPGRNEELEQIKRISGKKRSWLGRIFRSVVFTVIAAALISSCAGNRDQAQKPARSSRKPTGSKLTKITAPADRQRYVAGEEIDIVLEELTDTLVLDSAGFYFNGKLAGMLKEGPFEFRLSTEGAGVGSLAIRVVAWYDGAKRDVHNLEAFLLSDITPPNIPYRLQNTYPHDVKAYTQGLVYLDGFLYEGTGNYNESSLRKVIVKTGEPVRTMSLPGDIFGEGITIFNNRIYQLTYKSQVGFVYDLASFKRLQKVYYQNKEGWGLTHDGKSLIMSDGTNKIYYMDSVYFTEVRQLEVYDNKGPVMNLNELEYIEGKIFANIYGQEIIVIIDPLTGKVTGQLNMKGIMSTPVNSTRGDVFNGIAWDPEKRLLYVTGKYWPSLFEIRITGAF